MEANGELDLGDLKLQKVLQLQIELEEILVTTSCEEERRNATIAHIVKVSSDQSLQVEEFGSDLQWINTTRPLSLTQDLKGKIVVLDFFTYCCINCMHILPDLHYLEETISVEKGLIVIGVHSAKFDNEKNLENVIQAVKRFEIFHPVVNDPHGVLWNKLQVHCWPTLVILGPYGNLLFSLSGEGHKEKLLFYCKIAIEYFSKEGKIMKHGIPISYLTSSRPSITSLLFPGKICLDSSNKKLIISDSGHHRIIIVNKEGHTLHIIGGDVPGFKDGNFSEAKFHSPQGILWKDPELIYVADTKNHAVREIDLVSRMVVTICGTGQQGKDKIGGNIGLSQNINSPWDICLGCSDGGIMGDVLFIAMAGMHQIWMLALEDAVIFKERTRKRTCISIAGSGNEENRNNRYRRKAGFSQPSGITYAEIGSDKFLFIADSESSTVRCLSLSDGSVTACVGGDRDPLNLFAYGDADGTGINAKLQHPLGIAWSSSKKLLYVADSYNHKIKVIKPLEKICTTMSVPDMSLFEPGGLCISDDGKILYIADTNNHVIRIVNNEMMMHTDLDIIWEESSDVPDHLVPFNTIQNFHPATIIPTRGLLLLNISFDFKNELLLTDGARQTWQVDVSGDSIYIEGKSDGIVNTLCTPLCIYLKANEKFYSALSDVTVTIKLFLCHKEKNICISKTFVHKIPVTICENASLEQRIILELLTKL